MDYGVVVGAQDSCRAEQVKRENLEATRVVKLNAENRLESVPRIIYKKGASRFDRSDKEERHKIILTTPKPNLLI